jgi:hypothetical protein
VTGPGAPEPLEASPRLLHTALFAGGLFGLPLAFLLRWITPAITLTKLAPLLRTVALAVLFVQIITVRLLRNRISPLRPGQTEAQWWQAYFGPTALIWLVGAGLAVLGGVIFFVTGDLLTLFVGVAGVVLLGVARPDHLMRS